MKEHKEVWSKSYANELGRLTEGIHNIPGTNTMFFIHKSDIPIDRRKDIAYDRIVVVVRPQKKEKERTRLTVGGNLIGYPWEVATSTSNLTVAKLCSTQSSPPQERFLLSWLSKTFISTHQWNDLSSCGCK